MLTLRGIRKGRQRRHREDVSTHQSRIQVHEGHLRLRAFSCPKMTSYDYSLGSFGAGWVDVHELCIRHFNLDTNVLTIVVA